MKRSLQLLLLLFCLLANNAKAQTSTSMGLKGVVESYEIIDEEYYPVEKATFDPTNKRLMSFKVYCSTSGGGWIEAFSKYLTFKVKGKRPTNLSYMMENGGVCYRWTKLYFTFNYKWSGDKVTSVTHKVVEKENLNPDVFYDRHIIHTCVQKNYTTTYKYTAYDKYGNWIMRRAYSNGESWTEHRDITYDSEWQAKQDIALEKKGVDAYEKNNDIAGLESYLRTDLSGEANSYGVEAWNRMVCKDVNLSDIDSLEKRTAYGNATETTKAMLKNAWSNDRLHTLISSNDMEGLYSFSKDSMATAAAADSARAYWNEKEWASVADTSTSYQKIAKVAVHPFAYPAQAKEGWERVQQKYYDNVVLSHKDFRQVDDDLEAELEGKQVFVDAEYIQKTTYRRDSLRNAEIADYLQQSQTASACKDYKAAVIAAQHVLSINPNHNEAIYLSAENGKEYLHTLKRQKTLTDNDLAEYIAQNPKGKYTPEMMDTRALLLAKAAHSDKDAAKFDMVKSLPMSDKAREKVNELNQRTTNRIERGSFLHIGAEASVGYGFAKDILEYGGGAYMRFGWTVSPINITTGFCYTPHKNKSIAKNDLYATTVRSAMNYATMEIPLQLRWNFIHATELAYYLGVGAEYHLNKKGKIAYKKPENDEEVEYADDNLLKKSNFVGYYSLGLELKHAFGMEVYVKHDLTARFDKKYVRQNYCDENLSYMILDNAAEKTQLGKNWSFGIKMRFFY